MRSTSPCPHPVIAQDGTADKAQALNFLRTPAKSQRSPSPQEAATATPAAVYSLVDFIATPGTTKPLRRPEGEKTVGKVWGEDAEAVGKSASPAEHSLATPKKSFHEIIQEEAKAKQEREDYGGTGAWFVSGKPRSTSFESIIQQQRREERIAEEEQLRQMEEDMLNVALEMSKHEAQPKSAKSQFHSKGSRRGRGAQNGSAGAKKNEASRPRKHPPSACSQPQQSRNGRSRRAKRTADVDEAGPSNT